MFEPERVPQKIRRAGGNVLPLKSTCFGRMYLDGLRRSNRRCVRTVLCRLFISTLRRQPHAEPQKTQKKGKYPDNSLSLAVSFRVKRAVKGDVLDCLALMLKNGNRRSDRLPAPPTKASLSIMSLPQATQYIRSPSTGSGLHCPCFRTVSQGPLSQTYVCRRSHSPSSLDIGRIWVGCMDNPL